MSDLVNAWRALFAAITASPELSKLERADREAVDRDAVRVDREPR